MTRISNDSIFPGLRIVSGLTLLSRILGLLRDIGMATLFGNGMVFDAFSVAFRIPNLARRLFGEGALTAAFLPTFVRELEQQGSQSAWQLASALLTVLAVLLTGLVAIAEIGLWCLWRFVPETQETELLLGLTAVLLPYLIMICLAAQISSVLHALDHFVWPAFLPVLLNVVWIAAICFLAPQFKTPTDQIYSVAVCIVLAGCLQLVAPVPTLRRLGFRFVWDWTGVRTKLVSIARTSLPIVIGLSVTQLNTLCDGLIAWGFSPPAVESSQWLFTDRSDYPLEIGTASALYLGQRMYQFPLGIFGVALGTVLFPMLSRHAERGQLDRLRDDLSLGMRLVIIIGIPASIGLVQLAAPLTALLFQYSQFNVEDARQTAGMIAAYGIGVWAFCALLIVHRGFYALDDRITPIRIGMAAVLLNLLLNLTLIWYLGGRGLAISTAVCAMLQLLAVSLRFQQRFGALAQRSILITTLRTIVATGLMAAVCHLVIGWCPNSLSIADRLIKALVPLFCSVATFIAAAKLLRLDDLWLLFSRGNHRRT